MTEKFDLLKMLKEITVDEGKGDNKAKKISQDDIKKMLLERQKGKGGQGG